MWHVASTPAAAPAFEAAVASGGSGFGWASVRGLGVVLAATLLLVGCGPTEREKVERVAKERWHARSATCTRRSGNLYGCVLLRAHIPLKLQFTDDYLSSKQHRCIRANQTIVDVSTTKSGYACAFGRAS